MRNERIVIFSENRTEWIMHCMPDGRKEGIVVPIDVLSSREDVAYILRDCAPSMVFCSAEKPEFVKNALNDAGQKPEILVFEKIPADPGVPEAS